MRYRRRSRMIRRYRPRRGYRGGRRRPIARRRIRIGYRW